MEQNITNFGQHQAALLIKGALAIQGRKQKDLASVAEKSPTLLNLYLNRKIDLVPEDIVTLLQELGIEDRFNGLLNGSRDQNKGGDK